MNRDLAGLRPKKLSFKGVSSCVIRLMQSVKFNAEIPFSDVLTPSQEERSCHRWVSRRQLGELLTSSQLRMRCETFAVTAIFSDDVISADAGQV